MERMSSAAYSHLLMADHPTRDDIDLIAGTFYRDDPHEKWTWMREHAPVYFDPNSGVWGITRYHDVKAISKDAETFSNAGGIRPDSPAVPMMIDMDDPEHVRRRKLVNKGFTPRRVRDSEARINLVCDAIIDRVCEQGECDFVRDIAAPLPMIMIGDALGVAPEDRDLLLRWSDELLSALTGHQTEEDMIKAATAFGDYGVYAQQVIAERQREPRDDLMSVLVHAEVDGDRLDEESVIHESLLILIGGDETTRHVISGGMYQLLVNPDQLAMLRQDRGGLDTAVEEMLRWVSPIRNMARTATRDVELGGQTVPQGDKVLLFYPSANRDDEVFDDPFTFDSTRSPNEHVAFGFGTHFCLGNSLARLELKVMFDRILDRLPDLALVDSAEPASRAANFVSGYEEMPVRFTPVAQVGAVA
jgi:cytochrome P450 family 142 subfamily A polypeptide 1